MTAKIRKTNHPLKKIWSPIFPGDGTALIPLSRGLFSIIDAEDVPKISGVAWYAQRLRDKGFYAANKSDGKIVYMHRVIFETDAKEIDHDDGDGLNNRKANLKPSTRKQNSRNVSRQANSPLGELGIYVKKETGKFGARIGVDGVCVHLGYFDDIESARQARKDAELKQWGVLSRDNRYAEKSEA